MNENEYTAGLELLKAIYENIPVKDYLVVTGINVSSSKDYTVSFNNFTDLTINVRCSDDFIKSISIKTNEYAIEIDSDNDLFDQWKEQINYILNRPNCKIISTHEFIFNVICEIIDNRIKK